MERLLFAWVFLLSMLSADAQFLLKEDFEFSGNVSGTNGWLTQSGVSNFMQTTTPGLVFAGYPGSGIGNAVLVNGVAGEDVYKTIPARTKLYYSFLIKVTPATSTIKNDYVSFLGKVQNPNAVSPLNGNYFARIIIQTQSDGTWKIGTSNWSIGSDTKSPIYSNATFHTNQTYAVIVSFDMGNHYKVLIWVKENNFPYSETDARSPDVEFQDAPNTSALPTNIDVIGLRQSSSSPRVVMDALRVFDSWSAQVLPLTLLSFAAEISKNKNVDLKWTTAQSINVKHFELERSEDAKYFHFCATIPCINQLSERDYQYTDYNVNAEHIYYRLKIVDLDGAFVYSRVIHLEPHSEPTIKIGLLGGKSIKIFCPNTIRNGKCTIIDFNGIARKSISLTDGQTSTQVNLSELPTGIYVLMLEHSQGSFSQKFFLQ